MIVNHLIFCCQAIDKIVPIRTSFVNELLGSDYSDHNILHKGIGMVEAVEILKDVDSTVDLGLQPTGKSLGTTFTDIFK